MSNKYTVIKTTDIGKLNLLEREYYKEVMKKLNNNNEYWVVNKDEPYANQVETLIFGKASEVESNKVLGDKVIGYIELATSRVDVKEIKNVIKFKREACEELDDLIEKANRVDEFKTEVENAWKEEKKWRNKVQEYYLKNRSLEQDALKYKAIELAYEKNGYIDISDTCTNELDELIKEYQQQLEKEVHDD